MFLKCKRCELRVGRGERRSPVQEFGGVRVLGKGDRPGEDEDRIKGVGSEELVVRGYLRSLIY